MNIGTFLEYFDLMIYVHMAVLLDSIFFPTASSAKIGALLTALSICLTYFVRPIGAYVFGYIGDNIGRKPVLIVATWIMAISCVVMANVPTHAQIGITATLIVMLCRIAQGLSSMGEQAGAEIYLAETIDHPHKYFAVSLVVPAVAFGYFMAILVTSFCVITGWSWRNAFWIGSLIAFIGTTARGRLHETRDFVDMRQRMHTLFKERQADISTKKPRDLLHDANPIWQQKSEKKTVLAYFFISCGWPIFFYLLYIHCSGFLRTLGYTLEQIIYHNSVLVFYDLLACLVLALLTRKIHPIKILKFKALGCALFILSYPFMLNNLTPLTVACVQFFGMTVFISDHPAAGVFVQHFSIFKRFTRMAMTKAIAEGVGYGVTALVLIYVTDILGHWALLCVMLPFFASYYWAIKHFEKLEEETACLREMHVPVTAAA